MTECILIGIDSSTKRTGYSIFRNAVLVNYGVINLEKIKDTDLKFNSMCLDILNLLNTYKPKILVAELTSMERNAVTQRKLTMILGVIYGWCLQNDCECIFYRAKEWRSLISQHYSSKREEVKKWAMDYVKEHYQIVVSDDVAEAILIGQARINECDRWLQMNDEE